MNVLIIDNYDSFTYNLYQAFAVMVDEVFVYRNDRISIEEIRTLQPDKIVISPGPKTPQESGISKSVVETFGSKVPILGVCLGMQVINEVFGGETPRAPLPVHGKRSKVFHDGSEIFSGVPSPFSVARYHSLQCLVRSRDIVVTAEADDGVVMALQHYNKPLYGVQFHPESFLTEHGQTIIKNFLLST